LPRRRLWERFGRSAEARYALQRDLAITFATIFFPFEFRLSWRPGATWDDEKKRIESFEGRGSILGYQKPSPSCYRVRHGRDWSSAADVRFEPLMCNSTKKSLSSRDKSFVSFCNSSSASGRTSECEGRRSQSQRG